MKARLLSWLGAQPPRTLLLGMGGVLLLALLQGWLLFLRQPLGEYAQLRRDRAALETIAEDPQRLPAEIARVERDLDALAKRMSGSDAQLPPDRVIVHVVGRLAAIAGRHGAALHGVRPAGIKRVLMFDELSFEVQVGGAYASLLAWLQDVERELGPLVITQFSIKRGAANAPLGMDLRLAAYRLAESGGASR